jgi:uncharacterized membrane protein
MKFLKNKIIKEFFYIIIIIIISIIIFEIVFLHDPIINNIKAIFAFFWSFIIPGFFIMYYWVDKLEFIERIIMSFAVSTASIWIITYYTGLAEFHIKYIAWFIPPIYIIFGLYLYRKKSKSLT